MLLDELEGTDCGSHTDPQLTRLADLERQLAGRDAQDRVRIVRERLGYPAPAITAFAPG